MRSFKKPLLAGFGVFHEAEDEPGCLPAKLDVFKRFDFHEAILTLRTKLRTVNFALVNFALRTINFALRTI